MNRSRLALGLMSGTSADGLSLALVRVGPGRRLRILEHGTYSYPARLQKRILAAAKADTAEIARLNFDLGRLYAEQALRFLRSRGISAKRLSVVGSHGQTVIHLPQGKSPATLQIGEPSFLAERLGVPVVSDFRPRDMAAGGQGAPLVPFMDDYLFGDGPARALQNIGGIANISLVGRGVQPIGFDTGPGNCLMDLAVQQITRGRRAFDDGGRMAARGKSDRNKIKSLLNLPYFRKSPPKSLDRSEFGQSFLRVHFGASLRHRPFDTMATLADFTASSIADAYQRFVVERGRPTELVVSGGGALNPELMRLLGARLYPLPITSIQSYGIDPLAKEPAAFALMAWLAIHSKTNHLPAATGARGPRMLGKITS